MTRTNIFIFLTIFITIGVLAFGMSVLAADLTTEVPCPGGATGEKCYQIQSPLKTDSIQGLICMVLQFLASKLMPPVAVFMALYASFLLLTSVGNPNRVRSARQVLVYTFVGAGVLILSLPIVALVMSVLAGSNVITAPECQPAPVATTFLDIFINLINWFAWFIAVVGVATGLYSGFVYITGRGDPQKTAMAGRMIVYAMAGIVVAVLSFGIITIIRDLANLP